MHTSNIPETKEPRNSLALADCARIAREIADRAGSIRAVMLPLQVERLARIVAKAVEETDRRLRALEEESNDRQSV